MTWATYKEYFSYSNCGAWSFFLLIFYHFVINLNSIAVGLYLAFTLSKRFGKEPQKESSDQYYEVILLLIMVSSVVTSFGGKYLSNKIVSTLINHSWEINILSSKLHI